MFLIFNELDRSVTDVGMLKNNMNVRSISLLRVLDFNDSLYVARSKVSQVNLLLFLSLIVRCETYVLTFLSAYYFSLSSKLFYPEKHTTDKTSLNVYLIKIEKVIICSYQKIVSLLLFHFHAGDFLHFP